jgi:hypothetical protein
MKFMRNILWLCNECTSHTWTCISYTWKRPMNLWSFEDTFPFLFLHHSPRPCLLSRSELKLTSKPQR